ncbi:MAG: thiosulfate sulfurtransferase GlpE [Pontibacterium sp.]
MTTYQCICGSNLAEILTPETQVVDIRDPNSFGMGRISGAKLLNNENLEQVLAELDMEQPVYVCCYHGNSSKSAAQFLVDRGFEQSFSIDGGFEEWRGQFPQLVEQ